VSPPPRIAVVGRQNVGKSSLVNRLFGRRVTIAHDVPGVTRDRIELEASWRGRRFGLVDTAGYLQRASGVEALAAGQAERAAREADLVLLVVDVRTGPTEEDTQLARRLRRASTPVLVVANKADTADDELESGSFLALGLGAPISISALHGTGIGEVLDAITELLPEAPSADAEITSQPRFAIVGRPNVGKSSLFNRLLGEERAVVSEVPGTTRDSVDSVVDWPELGRVRFVDTAGMRRGGKVRGVEYYSYLRAAEAIASSHVAMLVLDAADGFTGEDKRIAARVMQEGRALLVAANKWDLVQDKDRTFKLLQEELAPFARTTAVRTSARTGQGVPRLPPILMELHRRWSFRASTSKVNEILHRAQRERPTPRVAGTLHYITQVGAGPPTFVVFGGANEPGPGYRRFLENRYRAELGLDGVPIRLRFRPREKGRRSGG